VEKLNHTQQNQTTQKQNDPHNTHTHLFNGPLSVTTRMSQYQKGKTNLDFTEARDSERQWHQHLTTQFFTDQMPFLLPNQQH